MSCSSALPPRLAAIASRVRARRFTSACGRAPRAPGRVVKAVETQVDGILRLELNTREAQTSLRFDVVPAEQGRAVAVADVVVDSEAWRAGVRRGHRLLAISDPVRDNEMWQLDALSSGRYVRDALKLRSSAFIRIHIDTRYSDADLPRSTEQEEEDEIVYLKLVARDSSQPGGAKAADQQREGASASIDDDPLSGPDTSMSYLDALTSTTSGEDDEPGPQTVAQRLEERYRRMKASAKRKTPLQRRIEKRQEYLSQVGERNDVAFFAVVLASILAVPAAVLVWASTSGYLDQLAQGYGP